MKFLSFCIIVIIALQAQLAKSQFLLRPWGLGLGWRRWDFGLGGLGWNLGLSGFPVHIPVAVPVINPVATPVVNALPAAGFGGVVLGKRNVNEGYGYNNAKSDDSSKMLESESKTDNHESAHLDSNQDIRGNAVASEEQNENNKQTINENAEKLHTSNLEHLFDNETLNEFFGNETELFNSTNSNIEKRAIILPAVAVPVPVIRSFVAPLVPVARFSPLVRTVPAVFGKRSVSNDSNTADNRTVCRLSTQKSVISCEGVNFNFECGVVANLTVLGDFEHKAENFRMLPEGVESFNRTESQSDVDVRRFEIVSFRDESSDLNDYTFVHGGQKVVLSLYWSENIQDLGFRFREQQCWKSYVDMLRSVGPKNVRLALDVARV